MNSQLSLRQGHEAIYDVQCNLNIKIKIVITNMNVILLIITVHNDYTMISIIYYVLNSCMLNNP